MPNIDPKVAFWFGLSIFIAGAIAQGGTALLSDAIPAVAIPIVVKWAGIISTLGTGIMTYIAGQNMTQAGRIQNVQQIPLQERAKSLASNSDVAAVVLKSQAAANANSSEKVLGPEDVKKVA